MPQDYIVKGQRYTLPDGLTNEEARAKIDAYLEKQDTETEEPKNESDTYEGFLAEVGEGILSGLINIPTGVVELGAELVDLGADTSYAKEVHETVEEWKKGVGIDPEGTAGAIAEGLVQFGIPGLGAASAVSKISKIGKAATKLSRGQKIGGLGKPVRVSLTKGEKVALATQQMVAAGVADAVVATDGTQTIGDFFESGPTITDKYNVGDSGSEDAARRLSNRLSFFVEGGALAGALPPVLSGLGSAFTKATTARLPVVETSVGELISAPANKITGAIGKRIEDAKDKVLDAQQTPSTMDKVISKTAGLLSPGGFLPTAKTIRTQDVKQKAFYRIETKGKDKTTFKKQYKTREDAEAVIRDLAITDASQTKRYKEINKEIDKISSDKNRVATDKGRIKDLEQERRQLIEGKFNELIENDFNVSRRYKDVKTGRIVVERIDIAKESSLINPLIEAYLKEAEGKFKGIENEIDKILKNIDELIKFHKTFLRILN